VGVYQVRKNADGTWGEKELVFSSPTETYDGIEVDICGNLYLIGFSSGRLFRVDVESREQVVLVDIDDPDAFYYTSLRWGADRGGWRRDVLHVTDRNKVFAVEVGVAGRRQPVDEMP
jgi:hypothetical protein